MNGKIKIENNVKPSEVKNFIINCGSSLSYFRYFDKRSYEIIYNHTQTILLYEENEVVGYGHLDNEKNKTWFGIVLKEGKKGKGYGKMIMNYLLKYYQNNMEYPLYLTVDIKNKTALKFFEKSGFRIENKINTKSFLMKYHS